ncbi:hypothetical protein H310_07263 [Aphanomyces invadans]|uniref:Uncharacterized protein n=1 Tax=Aphanomyces invadans TaxID=157072 RepID=A0A024U2P6_9STRA|nr:hypothetical protein H310_07263 [Aphanomyces invadans]ETW00706.1 hypothetical protein H310_07263 [Aphanomyces invadans]|eukprot:XP_008870841.1 hypothetical protein H310_07263 [Aphanomyces invadans]
MSIPTSAAPTSPAAPTTSAAPTPTGTGRVESVYSSPASQAENVWEHQREQRRRVTRLSAEADIGLQKPTMERLAPLLDLLAADASGVRLFDAHEPLRHDTAKPDVCRVKVSTGVHTNQVDEGWALKSVVYDNHHPGLESALADIGLIVFEALDRRTGVSFAIPVSRDDSKECFTMSAPHALDGFHVDILNFVHDVLWNYTQVSEALGARGSHYCLFFNSDVAPRVFTSSG